MLRLDRQLRLDPQGDSPAPAWLALYEELTGVSEPSKRASDEARVRIERLPDPLRSASLASSSPSSAATARPCVGHPRPELRRLPRRP